MPRVVVISSIEIHNDFLKAARAFAAAVNEVQSSLDTMAKEKIRPGITDIRPGIYPEFLKATRKTLGDLGIQKFDDLETSQAYFAGKSLISSNLNTAEKSARIAKISPNTPEWDLHIEQLLSGGIFQADFMSIISRIREDSHSREELRLMDIPGLIIRRTSQVASVQTGPGA